MYFCCYRISPGYFRETGTHLLLADFIEKPIMTTESENVMFENQKLTNTA